MLDRRYTESWRTTTLDINGGQEFVEFLDEEPDLSFTVYGDVRLDARVPARFDASSGRLLESGVQSERLVPQFIDVFNELKLRDRVHVCMCACVCEPRLNRACAYATGAPVCTSARMATRVQVHPTTLFLLPVVIYVSIGWSVRNVGTADTVAQA